MAYGYDSSGNRQSMTVSGTETYVVDYEYDENNRLLSEIKTEDGVVTLTNYVYDPNGNQVSKTVETMAAAGSEAEELGLSEGGVTLYSYNGFNMLESVQFDDLTTAEYTYRPDGMRAAKTVEEVVTEHVWDGSNIIGDYGDVGLVSIYIRGIGLIAMDDADGRSYYLYNGHGDVVQLTNASGAEVWYYDYDAFGNEREIDGQDASEDANPFRYCAEYFDAETGTIYLRARYYNPRTGRFLSEDPIRDGLNWYVYCESNPILFIDPWGLKIYYFYGDDQASAYETNKTLLEEQLGEEVIGIYVGSESDFVTGWNDMNSTSEDTVIINLHGKPESVTGVPAGFEGMEEKSMGWLYLLSCNAGHQDYENNMARQFYDAFDIQVLIACDGTHYRARFIFDTVHYVSGDKKFRYWREKANPGSTRKSMGFVAYVRDDNNNIQVIGLGSNWETLAYHMQAFEEKLSNMGYI